MPTHSLERDRGRIDKTPTSCAPLVIMVAYRCHRRRPRRARKKEFSIETAPKCGSQPTAVPCAGSNGASMVSATPESSRANRAANEIAHGRLLATAESEAIWGWSTPAGQFRVRRRADLIIDAAGLRPNRSVLEIGCGTGLFTAHFAATGARIGARTVQQLREQPPTSRR